MSDLPRVLCVDDEENILKAIKRSLRKHFDITTANSGKEGLEILSKEAPFAVIVSDMKMPEMTGAVFLRHVRAEWPDTVRVLLTGFADIASVTSAVNEGYIYRFLTKPCSAQVLAGTIEDAIRQHTLLTAERTLLEKTRKGSIKALTDILAIASPSAFGRATRICKLATMMAQTVGMEEIWQVEVAAMFCQVGSITLPAGTALKLYENQPLTPQEDAMVARIPQMSRSILANIPRLESVLDIMLYMGKNFDGTGLPDNHLAGEEIPLGSRILKLAEAAEKRQSMGENPARVFDYVRTQKGQFDPALLKIFHELTASGDYLDEVRGLNVHELRTGMILTEDVRSTSGVLLVACGQEVTVSLLERIQNYHDTTGLQLPLWVKNPEFSLGDEVEAETGVVATPEEVSSS